MPCPWYQNGFCTSPLLGVPTDVVVDRRRCLSHSEYRKCRFYTDPPSEKERKMKLIHVRTEPYLPISALNRKPEIGCEYAVVEERNGVYVVFCIVRQTYLTRWDVELCERHWRECPFRMIEHGELIHRT